MKRVTLITIIFFFFVPVYGQTDQIESFDEFLSALKNGEDIKAVIHYAECLLIADGDTLEAPDAIGGMSLSTFEYFAKMSIRNEHAFVSSSENVLISHPYYGYVYNYVKLRIYDNEKVEIIARYLDPLTLEVKMDETFYTVINNSQNAGGLYLFK